MTNRLIVCFSVVAVFGVCTIVDVKAQQSVAADIAAALAGVAKEYADTDKLLGKMKIEEKQLQQTKTRLDQETKRLQKEEADLRRLGTQIDLDQKALDTGLKQTWLSQGCREGRVTTDIPLANQCNAMADQINTRQLEINARAKNGIERANKFPKDQQKLSADTLKWAEDTKRVQARVADLDSLLGALKARFDGCPLDVRKARIEEIKLKCGSVQFDGARANLPPCTTAACMRLEQFILPSREPRPAAAGPIATPASRPVSDKLRATPQWQAFEKKETELVAQRQAVQGKIQEIEKNLRDGQGDKGQLQVQLVNERQKESNVTSQINVVKVEKESFQISFERTPAAK